MILEPYLTDEMPIKERLARIEYALLKEALMKHGSSRKAAFYVGMTPTAFLRKMHEYEAKYADYSELRFIMA